MSKERPLNDYQNFVSRLERRVELHEQKIQDEMVSLPSHLGKLVIVVSNRTFKDSEHDSETQWQAFHDEADRFADLRAGYYGGLEIRRSAKLTEIRDDLRDVEVSDMMFIGHGTIDEFWLDDNHSLGWRRVAKYARYLKQGRIEQRMCGSFNHYSAVPMGTFALVDQRDLIAPLGEVIDDVCPDEALFEPVYDKPSNSIHDILNLIRYFDNYTSSSRESLGYHG